MEVEFTAMVQTPTKPVTLEAFLRQPDTKPASEYIDGKIIQKPMPKADHSVIQTDLATAINASLKKNQKGRALTELRCTFDGRSIVPDITVLPWSAIPRKDDNKILGELFESPHWMIEILSEGQQQTKVIKKISHALEQGTQMGWLIDPAEDCMIVYTPDLRAVLYQSAEQLLPVPSFAQDFQLKLGELIGWLYD